MSWLFASGGQSIGASASVLPINIQDWFPLGLMVLSPFSPRDSQVFSNTRRTAWVFFFSSWFVFSFCSPPTTHPTPPCPALPLSLKVFKLQTWNVKRKEILNIHARAKSLQSCRFCAPLWTAAHQAPLSVGFSRQEYWSGLLCCPPGDLPDPGIEPLSLSFPALAGRFFTTNSMDIHTTFWITCPELASKPGRLHYMLTPDFWRKGRSVARFYLTCSWLCV